MLPNFFIFLLSYILITFSVLGYGLFFGRLINKIARILSSGVTTRNISEEEQRSKK